MSKPLNVLVLCYEYPPIGGGGGVGAKQYAEAWAAAGHHVTVLTSWDKGLLRRENIGGVDVIRVFVFGKKDRATATNLSMLCYLFFGFFYLLRHLFVLRRTEVINTHFSIPTGPLGVVASKLLSAPNILTIIGGDIYDPTKRSSPHRRAVLRLANACIINSANIIVAISSDTKKRATQHYKIRKPIHVINYGFEPMKIAKSNRGDLGLIENAYYLISVGRLVERKGFEFLIRSLGNLPDDVRLLIIGDGPLESKLIDVAHQEEVGERVSFLGYQPREKILRYLTLADCYVLSSLHEGLGIVVQEAMFAGLPIVSTDNGGQVDLVKDGRNGVLTKPADVDRLTTAIEKLYSDRRLAAGMAANNRQDIEQLYMSVNCEEYIAFFRDALGGRIPQTSGT